MIPLFTIVLRQRYGQILGQMVGFNQFFREIIVRIGWEWIIMTKEIMTNY
jgi:hypothetical protein